MKEIILSDITLVEEFKLGMYEVNVTLNEEKGKFVIITEMYKNLIENSDLSEEQIYTNKKYIKENFNSIKNDDQELIEQLNIVNQFFNIHSLKELKDFIRNEAGESWFEESEDFLLSTAEYNKNLVFSGGTLADGKLEINFEDSQVLYFGHSLSIEADVLKLDSVKLNGYGIEVRF